MQSKKAEKSKDVRSYEHLPERRLPLFKEEIEKRAKIDNNFLWRVEWMEVAVDIILNKEKRLVNLFYWSKVGKSSKTEATTGENLIGKKNFISKRIWNQICIIKERRLQEIDTNEMFSPIVLFSNHPILSMS